MDPGHRVRVLLEWYDADMSREQADQLLSSVAESLTERYPGALVASYVESNPPGDELP